MSAPLRLIRDGVIGARRNIAMTAAIGELRAKCMAPDTLRIYRYRRSVLMGRRESTEAVINRRECQRRGIEIARRVTGGGTVYMAPGVLAWDLVLRRPPGSDLAKSSARIGESVAGMLVGLGFPASFQAPGNVLVNGMKVAGSAGSFDGMILTLQGALLVDADLGEMMAVLKGQGGVAAAPAVATLRVLAGRPIGIGYLASSLATCVATSVERTTAPNMIAGIELHLARTLYDQEIGSDAFVFDDGESPDLPQAAETAA